MDEEFRVEVELGDEDHHLSLGDRLHALDLDDEASRREHDAYRSVSQQLSDTASRLEGLAREMTAYHDLPMGRHDMEAMTRPTVGESFAEFVARKQELLTLLQETIERDRAMLAQMAE